MLLEISNLTKHYTPEQTGVLSLSFAVGKGECWAAVGESGSGKSTLLQILAGFLPTDSGELRLDGKRLPTAESMLVRGYADIQLVPQDFRLLPNHKVWENILLPIRASPKAYQDEKLSYLAELLGLQGLLNRYPRELSGGQQQRTAIARALANEPLVLLLDEPFNQADAQTKQHLEQAFVELTQTEETAIILVTHDAPEALGLAGKMLVLQAGKLIQCASPTEIYEKPANGYVATLFGLINRIGEEQAVRAEYCRFADLPTAWQGELVQSFYQGYRYKTCLRMQTGELWAVYHEEALPAHETHFFVDFKPEKLLYF